MRAPLCLVLFLFACGGNSSDGGTGGNGTPSFTNDVKPILANGGCLGHHMTPAWDGVNALTSNADIIHYFTTTRAEECNGTPSLIAPGDSASSYLFQKVSASFAANCGAQTGSRMPLGGTPLGAAQLATLGSWIDDGALDN